MTLINTEAAIGVRFVGTIRDLEVKAFQFPLDLECVKNNMEDNDHFVYIARVGKVNVGLASCSVDHDAQTLWLTLGVLPNFRGIGVSRKLLSEASKRGMADKMHDMKIIVPSYRIEDKEDPDYIGGWLERFEFKIAGCESDYFWHYGKLWDGYVFGVML